MQDTYPYPSSESVYSFRSKPTIIYESEEREINFRGHLMYDRRIRRGNAYKQLPACKPQNLVEVHEFKRVKRTLILKRNSKLPCLPPLESGKKRIEVDINSYLVEQDGKIKCIDECTQMDAILEKPPSPCFIPLKTGKNQETQIYNRDLFEFKKTVEPLIDLIKNKVVEQARFEVLEEEELAMRRENQRIYEENRYQEIRDRQKLQLIEKQNNEEKQRLIEVKRDQLKEQKTTNDKIAAIVFSHNYVKDLVPSVHGELTAKGYFFDPVLRVIQDSFLPSFIEDVSTASYEKEQSSYEKGLASYEKELSTLDRLLQEKKSKLFFGKQNLQRTLLDFVIRKVVDEKYDAYKYGPPLGETIEYGSGSPSECSFVGGTISGLHTFDANTTIGFSSLIEKKISHILDAPQHARFNSMDAYDENETAEN